MNDEIALFFDESELTARPCEACGSTPSTIYASGAAIAESAEQLNRFEHKCRSLLRELRNSPDIVNNPKTLNRLNKEGFHLASDSPAIAREFFRIIHADPALKFHYRFSRTPRPISQTDKTRVYALLHASIIAVTARRYRESARMRFQFEEYDDLNDLFEDIVSYMTNRSWGRLSPEVRPETTTSIVSKLDSGVSSAVDYVILTCSRVIQLHDQLRHQALCTSRPNEKADPPRLKTSKLNGFKGDDLLGASNWKVANLALAQASISSTLEIKLHPGVLRED